MPEEDYEVDKDLGTKVSVTYFEYERKDGSRFLSIIAWDEWDLAKYDLEFIEDRKYRYEKRRVW